jgi:hypothetical protein
MGYKFWIIRAIKVFTGVLILLFSVQLLKQHSVENAIMFAITWSFLTTSVFIGHRFYQSRKGIKCVLCNDTPSAREQKK